jgi:quercetin 2,3-dioxygenase
MKPASTLALRRSADRGHFDHGWLRTWHSFSFADYHDPAHMGFRSLRVINQDIVAPGQGFPMHGHRDMEIFSYVVEGAIEHRDSMGNHARVVPGQIQVMGAGTGVRHSEYNPLPDQPMQILQVWILPEKAGLPPFYAEWTPTPEQKSAPKSLMISRDGRDGSARLRQDADVFRLLSPAGSTLTHQLRPGRGLWLQVVRGEAEVDGHRVGPGDGLSTEDAGSLSIRVLADFEALLFDLA